MTNNINNKELVEKYKQRIQDLERLKAQTVNDVLRLQLAGKIIELQSVVRDLENWIIEMNSDYYEDITLTLTLHKNIIALIKMFSKTYFFISLIIYHFYIILFSLQ